jgi:TonB family protein
MTLVENEQADFRKMVGISTGVHFVAIIFMLIFSSSVRSSLFNEPLQSSGPMNVMWATTVQSGPKTPDNKLPAPIVVPEAAPAAAKEEPKVVMPENLKNTTKAAPKKENTDEARRKAMAEALASLNVPAGRPTPRPENFPSMKGGDKTGQYPAGPGGGGGGISTDPIVAAYVANVRKVLAENLIWVQKDKPQVIMEIRLDDAGNVLESNIVRSSGNPAYDAAVMRSLRKSSPLPPPPPGKSELTLDFRLR